MKTTTKTFLTLLTASALTLGLQAQTTYTGGPLDDIAVGTNWDNGLPTAPGNPGTLSSVADWTSTNSTLTDFYMDIVAGGDLGRDTFFTNQGINGGVWTVNGGSMSSLVDLSLSNSASLTLNTGNISFAGGGRDLGINSGTSFTMTGGTLNGDQGIDLGGGTFTVDGGTASGFSRAGTNFGSSGTMNFNAGSFTAGNWGSTAGTIGTRTINLGSGSGTAEFTGNFEAFRTTIDWATGSGMSFTISGSLLNGGAATTFEDLYTGGQLLFNGANTDPFASVFDVSGNTLTLIPEPSSIALLGLAGLAGVLFMRRRK